MTTPNYKKEVALKKRIDRYNLIITGLFTISLVPVTAFYLDGKAEWEWFFIILVISLIFGKFPNALIDNIQLSKDKLLYKKLGVHFFKRYATNGDVINKNIRKQFPNHRNIHNSRSVQEKLVETYTTEKTHWVFFVFCLLTGIYAYHKDYLMQAMVITAGNIIFNLYPIFLQQYNRIRYKHVLSN